MGETTIDHTHSLFLGLSDTLSSIAIPAKLTRSENYGLWSRPMRIAPLGKRKLGFVTDSWIKESYKRANLQEQWETCNVIVLSRIMNNVCEEILGGIIYALDVYIVWEDLLERFDKVNRVRIFNYIVKLQPSHRNQLSFSPFHKIKGTLARVWCVIPFI